MTVYRRFVATTLAVVIVALCAPLAHAHLVVFDEDETTCRKEVSKNLLDMVEILNKVFTKCHKNQQGGIVANGVNCNDLSAPEVDPKGRVARTAGKATAGIAKKCGSLDSDVLSNYISCPIDPCTGVTNNPMQTYAELANCLVCLAETSTSARSTALLGAINPAPTGDDARCSRVVARNYGRLINTMVKDRRKCQVLADEFATTHIENSVARHCTVSGRGCTTDADCQQFLAGSTCAGCVGLDARGKIAKAKSKAERNVDRRCPVDTTGIFPCGDPDPAVAKACLAATAESHGDEIVLASYQMDATICPVGIRNLIFAGDGVGEDLATPVSSRTSLEVGHTGLGHPQDLPDRYALELSLTCAAGSTPCGECSIDGVNTAGASASYLMRCRDDRAIPCTMPFMAGDPACPSPGFCSYFLSGPLPLAAGNSPVCVSNRLDSDVVGTANVETGEGSLALAPLFATIATGESLTRPCPICAGKCVAPLIGGVPSGDGCVTDNECDGPLGNDGVCDLTTEKANDNIKAGICIGGRDNGAPCDVHSFDRTFSPVVGTGTSLDCPQIGTADISTIELQVNLTTGTTSLPFGTLCEGAFGTAGFMCACALCSGNLNVACNSDAECSAIGAGTCTANKPVGAERIPNNCIDDGFICMDTGDGINGVCATTPPDTFCDGVVRASGEGFLTCFTNGDCSVINPQCNGDCGNCEASAQRRCFLDPIVATGVADSENPVLVSTFCIPPTTNDGVNLTTGTPGPARVRLDSHVTKQY